MEFRTALGIVICFLLNFVAEILRTLSLPDPLAQTVLLAVTWALQAGCLIAVGRALYVPGYVSFKVVYGVLGLYALVSLVISVVFFIL